MLSAASPYLQERLQVFVEAGLIPRLPTSWQLQQGTIEMTPYVASTDATEESQYLGAPFGHALVRQPLIAWRVGLDHFRPGSALKAKKESVLLHLLLTYHTGMPVFDLQLLQTHPSGLTDLEARIEEYLANQSREAQRHNRFMRLILSDAATYYRAFLGVEGWIARARRFDYPHADDEGSEFPREFFSLVTFVNHCSQAYPETISDVGWLQLPQHLSRLAGRRFREGKGFGWLAGASR